VESIKDIESDHYLTQVINHLLRNKLTPEILTATFSIISTIESDHYRSDVLNNLFQKQGLTDSQFTSVLNLVGSIGSDHYKSTVLTRAASGSLSESQLIQVIQVTKRIESDHYATEVLTNVAPKVKAGSTPLKDAYRDAAKSISSETYYSRAVRAID
jgi:hypothetical protein